MISHVVPPASHPRASPSGFPETPEELTFDAALHLQLEPPAYVRMLAEERYSNGNGGTESTDLVAFPLTVSHAPEGTSIRRPEARALVGADGEAAPNGATVPFNGLAFTAPFRLLSDAGVKALRQVIAANEKHAAALPSRAAKALRGLGYRSKVKNGDSRWMLRMVDVLSIIAMSLRYISPFISKRPALRTLKELSSYSLCTVTSSHTLQCHTQCVLYSRPKHP